jgi:hypothetical protein
VTTELLQIKPDREVRTFGAHDENANLTVLGHGRGGERKVSPEVAAEGVSRFGAVEPECGHVPFYFEGDDGRRKLHVILSIGG